MEKSIASEFLTERILFLIFKIYFVRLAYRKRRPPKELRQIKSTAFIHLAKLQKCPTWAKEREDSSQPA